jgi:hypothetical protein
VRSCDPSAAGEAAQGRREEHATDITISKTRLRPVLLALMALVAGAGLAVELLKPIYKLNTRRGVVPIFSLSYEQNVPTWYSSSLLLVCSLLLAITAAGARKTRQGFVSHWAGLAAAFLYISLDEFVQLHEGAGGGLKLNGVLYFSWVVPASIVVAFLGVIYLRFLAHLPRITRVRFIVAGTLYVAGALGMELPLGYWTERAGTDNVVYAAIDFVEESMEMLGMNLFLLALVDYLGAQGFSLAFAAPAARPQATLGDPAPAAAQPDA